MVTRHKVADEDQLSTDGSRVIVDVEGVEIAVVRFDGEYYALANHCIHQGGPLCEGDVTGLTTVGEDGWEWDYDPAQKYVRCPWHGWIFDVTTGENVDADRYVTPTYDVEVEDGELFVVR